MAQVEVTINNRAYRIACDDGQEQHLSRLAEYVDQRVQELVVAVGQVGDDRLLVMASLLIADELSETIGALQLSQQPDDSAAAAGEAVGQGQVAETMETLAERIERIAAKLEAA
jgi:cell division protein ZapA